MRDLTKSYKKIDFLRWHQRKYFIRINCAIMMAILLIILLLMFPIVSDAYSISLSDYFYIKEFFKPSIAQSKYSNVDSAVWSSGYFDGDPYNYYDDVKNIFDSTDMYINSSNDKFIIYTVNGDSDNIYIVFATQFGFGFSYASTTPNTNEGGFYQKGGRYRYSIIDNTIVVDSSVNTDKPFINCFICGNMPVVLYGNGSSWTNTDINYLVSDGLIGINNGDDQGFMVTPNYPDESADNNLVFNQSDFIFTHQTYYAPYSSSINTGSAVPVGTISFKGQPNNYQLEHSSEFELQFTFSFDYNVNYKNYNSAVGYFKQTNSILGNQKNLKLNIVNNVPITVPLSTFINNKNQYSIDIKSVFDSLLIDNNTSLSGLLAQSKEITELSYNQFLITCNARLVSNGKSSGTYTENYNFNSRKGLTTDKSIEDNPNPYVPNPSDQANDDPDSTNIEPTPNVPGPGGSDDGGSSGGSTSSAQANPNIVINNNPIFNNNPSASASASADGSGNLLSKLIDTLFGAGNVQEGSIGGHTQQQLITNTGASRWFQVANDSMSWIPASVWSELLMFLGITLGILVVAFILRVILDFL